MRKLLQRFFRSQAKPAALTAKSETDILSAISNEGFAQGYGYSKIILDRITDMLDDGNWHPDESPLQRARRAYSGYQAAEKKFKEFLLDSMNVYIKETHESDIEKLGIQAEVAELLGQVTDAAHESMTERVSSLFKARADDLAKAELRQVFLEDRDPMEWVRMSSWMPK